MSALPAPSAGTGRDKLDRDLLLVASVVVLGAIMSILDVTVVNVAINTLAREFDTTLPTILTAKIVGPMADAFGATYWWAFALVVLALVIATPLLPKHKPAPVDDPRADVGAGAGAPVLAH